jgi:hypothetical protein
MIPSCQVSGERPGQMDGLCIALNASTIRSLTSLMADQPCEPGSWVIGWSSGDKQSYSNRAYDLKVRKTLSGNCPDGFFSGQAVSCATLGPKPWPAYGRGSTWKMEPT